MGKRPDLEADTMTTAQLRTVGIQAGLAAVGVTDTAVLEPARSVLPSRREMGLASTMQFTYRNPERSTDPSRLLPGAASLVVGVFDYERFTRPTEPTDADGSVVGRVARYATFDAYAELRAGLGAIAAELEGCGYRTRVVADDNALVDRNAAWRAGLGWYGKNTNLLVRGSGSWYVIGAVATDAVLSADSPPVADGCGPCSACLDDCPTGALVAPGVLDARRCIAWLVQAGEPIPVEHRAAVDDWLYGCDICQDVCPPNRVMIRRGASKTAGQHGGSTSAGQHGGSTSAGQHRGSPGPQVDVMWVLSATDDELLDRCGRWYIAGRNPDVIRRTALVVLGNRADGADPATSELLSRYVRDPSPLLRAHAVWASRRLGLDDLATATRDDPDALVRAEWASPVAPRHEERTGG
ncbi:MAG: epoxyqueuosine reductase [Acidimicrobiales bacterium]